MRAKHLVKLTHPVKHEVAWRGGLRSRVGEHHGAGAEWRCCVHAAILHAKCDQSQCSPWHHESHHAARQMANRQRPIVCFKLSRMGERGRCFREGFARLA